MSSDDSLFGPNGRAIHLSPARLIADVIEGGGCFICARARSDAVPFNDEHIVPQWLLRAYGLHDRKIRLPNSELVAYRSYTVPCCQECNSALGKVVEDPVRELLLGGPLEGKRLELGDIQRLFCWLALLFLKTHLKDMAIRWNRDRRKGLSPIGAGYDWGALHHIQCLARCPVAGVTLRDNAIGTLIMHPAATGELHDNFDYGDHMIGRAAMVRVGDWIIFSVFNDCGMTEQVTEPLFRRLGRLSAPQAREVMAYLCYTNLRLKERPDFHTYMNRNTGEMFVHARVPEHSGLLPDDQRVFGGIVYFMNQEFLLGVDESAVKEGRYTWLFDANGKFIEEGLTRVESLDES
ncbi:MAG TPA: hypothetical protein VH062_01475 [Polyangiaceae bacterium]|nr:hypothetical protein [Polyangiaceae bacterium]